MTDAIWWVLIPVCLAGAAVAGFALGKRERPQTFTSAERIEELKEELRHARGRIESLMICASGDDAELERLRRRLQFVEGLMSRSVWLENRRLNLELTKAGATRLCADLERMLQSNQVIRLCWDMSAERALALIEELRRFPNDARDDDGASA